MKILVIPDLHNMIKLADAIIAKEGDADKCIFLGDIWDQINDNPDDAYHVAEWVRSRIFDDRFIFLWGNHDITYGFRNQRIPCAGYSIEKDIAIWKVLNEECWRRWKFFWIAQGFLFTHGGLHPNYLPPHWKEKDITATNLKTWLSRESEKCLIELNMIQGEHWFFRAGEYRCPTNSGIEAGGILWCDAYHEFTPVPRLSQIFGHTPRHEWPLIIFGESGLGRINSCETTKIDIEAKDYWNVCLDCHSKFYGVVENGILRIKSSPNI
jgi:hypothetical protein